MATRDEVLLPLRPALVPVPANGQIGICAICHSNCPAEFSTCYPCRQASTLDPPSILPISMSISHGLVHHHLRMYKDAPDELTRGRLVLRLAALLSVFMENHGACVGEWDMVTCVPSERRVAMASVVAKLQRFQGRTFEVLRAQSEATGRALDPDRFQVTSVVSGQRVLLLDDTFTTGASLFSAIAALRQAGAVVVGPVVLGRHVQASWAPSQEMMSWLADRTWDEHRCCRCNGERRDAGALF
jgi:hypothetical protein